MTRVLAISTVAVLSLAGCAANREKVPVPPGQKLLLDRIEALETDISELHAEMQELRVEYLPVGELSEDEFERHVQKRLELVPAERRATLEKELRAKRKNATLSGKGLETYWDDRFAKEADDDPWSKQAATACRPKIEGVLPKNGKLTSFECRKERCRIELDAPGEPDADAAMNACATDTETFAGVTATSHVTTSNGRVRIVAFAVRKGYSMTIE